MLLGIITKKK